MERELREDGLELCLTGGEGGGRDTVGRGESWDGGGIGTGDFHCCHTESIHPVLLKCIRQLCEGLCIAICNTCNPNPGFPLLS